MLAVQAQLRQMAEARQALARADAALSRAEATHVQAERAPRKRIEKLNSGRDGSEPQLTRRGTFLTLSSKDNIEGA